MASHWMHKISGRRRNDAESCFGSRWDEVCEQLQQWAEDFDAEAEAAEKAMLRVPRSIWRFRHRESLRKRAEIARSDQRGNLFGIAARAGAAQADPRKTRHLP